MHIAHAAQPVFRSEPVIERFKRIHLTRRQVLQGAESGVATNGYPSHVQVMNLDLTDEEAAALLRELDA